MADVSIPTVAKGATSPSALAQMLAAGVDVYTAQYLHAKVFAFAKVAFVGSTNASQHSAKVLMEAALKVETKREIRAARGFVESLCITKLTASDLKDLATYYKPFSPSVPPARQRQLFSTLLMELTLEQGVGRATQVQPPKRVWEKFFGLTHPASVLPTFTLLNERTSLSEVRPVVRHHHTYTIEIADADLPRPAILQMRRAGQDRYVYRVHRPSDPTFGTISHVVEKLHNPDWTSGRRWVLV